MSLDVKQAQIEPSTMWGSSALEFLRRHPLTGYFLLAYGLQWLWEFPMFALWHEWFAGPWLILSPILAAFFMAWVIEGKAGIGNLLRRCLVCRASMQWYLVATLCIPTLFMVGLILMPGALPAFRAPGLDFLLTYLLAFVFKFLPPRSPKSRPGVDLPCRACRNATALSWGHSRLGSSGVCGTCHSGC
jgi:hypothetical protein